jgi:tetratricopeptide (TPR) repeat protein
MRSTVVAAIALLFTATPLLAANLKDSQECAGNDPDQVIAACTRIIQDKQDSADNHGVGYSNRAGAFQLKGEIDRAIADYSEAIKLVPNYGRRYYRRGLAYSQKGDFDRAIADYNTAIRIEPDFAEAYVFRAFAHHAKGNYDLAIADYDALLRIQPEDAALARYGRGIAKLRKGDKASGEADIAAAKAIRSDVAEVLARYGIK